MGLATYVDEKLQGYSGALVAVQANSLLSSAVGAWGPKYSPSMATTARVVEVLLRHGASPNTTTYRARYVEYPARRNLGRLDVPSSVCIDVLEAGYSTWAMQTEDGDNCGYFRFKHDGSLAWRLRTNFGSYVGSTYRSGSDQLREWIDIIKLLLQYGAKLEMDQRIQSSPFPMVGKDDMVFEWSKTPIMMVQTILRDYYPDDLAELESMFKDTEQSVVLYLKHSQNTERSQPSHAMASSNSP